MLHQVIDPFSILVPEEDVTNNWHTVYYADLFALKYLNTSVSVLSDQADLTNEQIQLLSNANNFLDTFDKEIISLGPTVMVGYGPGWRTGYIEYKKTYRYIRFKNIEDATYFKLTFL